MSFIPDRRIKVIERRKLISIGENQGIYIKDVLTGIINLEKGPKSYWMNPHQEFWKREYTNSEKIAFKIPQLSNSHWAIPLVLENNEYALIIKNTKERVEWGPQKLILEPDETIKIHCISGDTPKRPNMHYKWKIFCGPMFVSDELSLRTKDNAVLSILVRYKTRFHLDAKNLHKIFQVEDFIGYATETMAAIIRQEAAQHDFEEFHINAGQLIKSEIFGSEKRAFIFPENNFEIFDIDVKNISPQDPDIAAQLNAAIKSNMEIYVYKMEQIAQLEAERQLVEGRIRIEEVRKELIAKEQENYKFERIQKAKIDAEAKIIEEKAKTEALKTSQEIINSLEKQKTADIMEQLHQETAEKYLQLQQIKSFESVHKTMILPSDSKIFVPFDKNIID